MNFLQGNDDTRRFGRMRTKLGECRIAPIRDVYHLATLRLPLGHFDQLQHVVQARGVLGFAEGDTLPSNDAAARADRA